MPKPYHRPIPIQRVVYTKAATDERIPGSITHVKKGSTVISVWDMYRFVPEDGSRVRWISAISFSTPSETA